MAGTGKATAAREARDTAIHLRASSRQRALIDRAAEVVGKNRSDFMLEAACREADNVLLDRQLFSLDDKAYRKFIEALDRPPSGSPRLRRLLASQAPWEE